MYESKKVNDNGLLNGCIDALVDVFDNDDMVETSYLFMTLKIPFAKSAASSNSPSSDIWKVISTGDGTNPIPSGFHVNGKVKLLISTTLTVYRSTSSTNQGVSLIDCGENGGIVGDNIRIIS
jgi:hypothetical protein